MQKIMNYGWNLTRFDSYFSPINTNSILAYFDIEKEVILGIVFLQAVVYYYERLEGYGITIS